MKYTKPVIELIDRSVSDLSFYLWLKSRQWVITDNSGNKFMTTFHIDDFGDSWIDQIPDEFIVGSEVVNKNDYKHRIENMNLQYNNFDNFVFEIQGSCLFRDMLFNISKISQWAQSNRFLFSILDENQIYNEDNYTVSEEYKGIPEWEDQFKVYMDTIKNDPIVDHNRLQMPYSISSTFWISVNKKTLIDICAFMKQKVPFLYDVYGVQFEPYIGDIDLNTFNYSTINQYIFNYDNFEESKTQVYDTIVLTLNMGLILYSQFIRQSDVTVSGYYNILIHDNPEEFKHKVFKGDTVFPIKYVAHIDKALSTVRTRLCAFAMSSGDGPTSWNYFLKKFLPENLNGYQLKELLPCKFNKFKLAKCKFHDDIKFRNEGKELSNCPCPLVSLSLKDAMTKKERDNNVIGDAYYELTQLMISDGRFRIYNEEHWTSMLTIETTVPNIDIDSKIRSILDSIEYNYHGEHINNIYFIPELYLKLGMNTDVTYILKGLAIDLISKELDRFCDSYLINFGGDILIKNLSTNVKIEDTKFNIKVDGTYSIFTSGNTNKRGNHIIGGGSGFTTIVINWGNNQPLNILADALATKLHADQYTHVKALISEFPNVFGTEGGSRRMRAYKFNNEGSLLNLTYCASPFFDSEQIEIRDKMIEKVKTVFRPDLTDSSKIYDSCKGNITDTMIENVVNENIFGIEYSDILVFPMHTTDLGTLFEVGLAAYKQKSIIKYDHITDQYFIDQSLLSKNLDLKSIDEDVIFDCTDKKQVILMGYNALSHDNLNYELKGAKDNIMLSHKYTHYENVNGEYVIKTRDNNEKDS